MVDKASDQKMMKAVVLEDFSKPCVVKEVPIPKPGDGQVLIKMEASPINPSDLSFLKGYYSSGKTLPTTPGFEGAGTVVANGGGIMGWSLVGKRVACAVQSNYGCYAEYAVTSATNVIPIPDDVSFDQAASTFVNPLTVMAMCDTVKDQGVKAVVHTAAASALGKMMVRYFKDNGVRVINVVRRQEQVDALKELGAELVFNSTDEKFEENLRNAAETVKATVLFDAVAGSLTGQILKNMPKGSKAYVYGALSMKPSEVNATDLIFKGKSIQGFWLTDWIKKKNLFQLMMITSKVKTLLKGALKTEISGEYGLDDINTAADYYTKNMSKGKVLIKPNLKPKE